MKKILVPVDGSEYSKKALEKAKAIAKCMNSEVEILNVVVSSSAYLEGYSSAYEGIEKYKKENSEKIVKEALELFNDFEGKVDTKIRHGNPAEMIIEEAESGGYDLIVIGSKGMGVFSRILLGSVSNNVVHHSDISVLVVR